MRSTRLSEHTRVVAFLLSVAPFAAVAALVALIVALYLRII